jgi:hypothetical protein
LETNALEILYRLKLTMLGAPTQAERELARQLYAQRVETHTKPTEKNLQPVVWP